MNGKMSTVEKNGDFNEAGKEAEDDGCGRCCVDNLDNCCGDNCRAIRSCGCCIGECSSQVWHGCRHAGVKKFCSTTFTLENFRRKFPFTYWLPKYRLKHLLGDMIAGFTVGLTVLPQGLAYSRIAGLPPEYGLYTAFMCCYVYTILGTAKDINLGPAAVMSLLTERFGSSPIEGDATYAIVLALGCGVVQFLMGLFHLGFIVDYVSHPVIQSFTQASVLTIMFSQVDNWLGLKGVPREFFPQIYWIFKKLPETRIWDFLLGLVCMTLLFLMKKMKSATCIKATKSKCRRAFNYIVWLLSTARNAVVVVAAALLAKILVSSGMESPFTLTGKIPDGLPPFQPPKFTVTNGNETYTASDIISDIGIGFLIVPLVGFVESIAIGKAFARKNKYTVDPNQELLAMGTGNILGSFVSAYPVTGSFSRSAVNGQSGVMTPAGGIFTGTLVILALAFLTPWFYYIPDSALASIIIMAVIDMLDYTILIELWHVQKIDLIPWILTFIFALTFGIENGLIVGIVVSLFILLYPSSRPKIQVTNCEKSEYVIVEMDQGLRFPSAEYFKDHIRGQMAISTTGFQDGKSVTSFKSIILDFCHISAVDITTIQAIEELNADLQYVDALLILARVRPNVMDVLLKAHIKDIKHTSTIESAVELVLCEKSVDEISLETTGSMAIISSPDFKRHDTPVDLDHHSPDADLIHDPNQIKQRHVNNDDEIDFVF